MTTRNLTSATASIGLAIALALSQFGCDDQPAEPSQTGTSPLVDGTFTTARPEVGKFFSPSGLTHQSCTATLISPHAFVTAAQCIDHLPHAVGGTFHMDNLADGSGSTDIPIRDTFSQGRNDPAIDDIAVGRLTSDVPATQAAPASIATFLNGGDPVTLIGYGCLDLDSDCTFGGFKNFASFPFRRTDWLAHQDLGGPLFRDGLFDGGPIARIGSGWQTVPWIANSRRDIFADAIVYRNQILSLSNAFDNPGFDGTPFGGLSYRAQVQDIGWQAAVTEGGVVGTPGQGKRLEALQIWHNDPSISICYQSHVENVGWQTPAVCDGEMSGTWNQSLRLEAIRIWVKNRPDLHVHYNVWVPGFQWQGDRQDGEEAGTHGLSLRIEGIFITLQNS